MDVPTFQAAFPAFRDTDVPYLEATLARAARWHDPRVWGCKLDDGIALLTAHWLSIDPFGTTTALKADATSVYLDQWKTMRNSVAGGFAGARSGRW